MKSKEQKFLIITSVFLTWGYAGYELFDYTKNLVMSNNPSLINSISDSFNARNEFIIYSTLVLITSILFATTLLIILYGIINGMIIIADEKKADTRKLNQIEIIIFDGIIITVISLIISIATTILLSIIPVFIEYLFSKLFHDVIYLRIISIILMVVAISIISINSINN